MFIDTKEAKACDGRCVREKMNSLRLFPYTSLLGGFPQISLALQFNMSEDAPRCVLSILMIVIDSVPFHAIWEHWANARVSLPLRRLTQPGIFTCKVFVCKKHPLVGNTRVILAAVVACCDRNVIRTALPRSFAPPFF